MDKGSLAYKIFLDRYAVKDLDKNNLAVGDLVIVQGDGRRDLADVVSVEDNRVFVKFREDGEVAYVDKGMVDRPVETEYAQCCARVAEAIDQDGGYVDEFLEMLVEGLFVPGGRVLAGAGSGQDVTLSNCYVIASPHDSRKGIYKSLGEWTELMSRGGGVGVNLSTLRPKNAVVKGVNGRSSGTVSWADMFSQATGTIIQGGSRRGAGIAILEIWHPDVIEFIDVKQDNHRLNNLNISVGVTDAFMTAVEKGLSWDLVFPDTTYPNYDNEWRGDIKAWMEAGLPLKVYNTVSARWLWTHLCTSAWRCAEPGLWFIDRANALSNSYYYSRLVSVNPCGEVGLPYYGQCNLGHINLSKMVLGPSKQDRKESSYQESRARVNWNLLEKTVTHAVRFLDNCLDVSFQPMEEVKHRVTQERRLGLGTFGLAELLIRVGLRYGSPTCVEFCDYLYGFIKQIAYETSRELGREKGSFEAFDPKRYAESSFIRANFTYSGWPNMRNVCLLTQAPTGTVATMMETSTGIEPFFSFEWERSGRLGSHTEVAKVVRELDTPTGELPEYFVNAMGSGGRLITPEEHIAMQAVIQKHVDNCISKTINLPTSATIEDVQKAYEGLYYSGCKGGTVYRDKSRDVQVLNQKAEEIKPEPKKSKSAPKVRDRVRDAKVISVKTPMGTAHITMTVDSEGQPNEVFIDIGKGGSDVKAHSEGYGRLISMLLQEDSSTSPIDRLNKVIEQLGGIGGAHPQGFGKKKVRSLPDSISQALTELKSAFSPDDLTEGEEDDSIQDVNTVNADLCPSCGCASLIATSGCNQCRDCGYSACG
jgi:ribonucleoside-diphosphate reductase alpha chain